MACFGFVKVNCCNEHKQPFSKDAVKQRLFDVQRPGDPEKTRLRTWLNPSNPEICASSHYECVWVTLDSTHLLDSKSNIQSLRVLDGFQDFARNPHETCTQTDWILWHENFDHHQIARISQCSTGLQVQINIHKNEHIWLSAMTVPHSDSKRRICRQKNMQRPIAAGRTTSVIMLGIKLATNHAEAKHCTTDALFCWKLLN